MKRPFTPRNTKAVFFDMNNTLVDPKASFDACFVNVLVDFAGRWDNDGEGWDPGSVLATYKAQWNGIAPRLAGKPQELERAKKQCLEAALRRYPFLVNDAFVHSFFREMRRQMRDRAVLVPNALEAVAKLSGAYRLGIITNGGKEQQERVMNRLGLADYIAGDLVVASNRSGVRKPNPAIFRSALSAAGVRPGEAVMVGDSWKNDILGAVKCGMNAVWLNRAGARKSSRRKAGSVEIPVVAGFGELTELFEPLS
ncbi:HAD family hydrolase [Paenibacillus sp. GYB003]|uniref:HAD family hydrolase n=1 Tax=Paenibacillus sp. GYB003 TaxID=2994392 RepID=UPI002F96BD1E